MWKLRRNPYAETNRQGYLKVPQFSGWGQVNNEDSILWVHATEDDVSKWKEPNFQILGERFYIGAGANASQFGSNLVFVRYKPTKIFDPDDLEYFPKDVEDFMACMFEKLEASDPKTKALFLEIHSEEGYFECEFPSLEDAERIYQSLPKSTVKEALRRGLKTTNFRFFEVPYAQACLLDMGYTAYFESEGFSGIHTSSESVNLAILKPDFKNIEVVATLKRRTPESSYFECPVCGGWKDLKELLEGTLRSGEVQCQKCETGADCDVCGERTHQDSMAVEELDSWGEWERVICQGCEDDRKCVACEEYFDESELTEAKFKSRYSFNYCTPCFKEELTERGCEYCDSEFSEDEIEALVAESGKVEVGCSSCKPRTNPLGSSFIAYHGSQHGDCEFDPAFESVYEGAVFFSLNKEHAKSFSKRSEVENVCTFKINAPLSKIFDSADETAMLELEKCLRGRFEQYRVDSIMQEVEQRLWTSFDPKSWPGSVVSECIKNLGYVGWFEREVGTEFVGNFGLYDASIAELISIEYFCSDCEDGLQKSPRGSYLCGSCKDHLCPKCFSVLEWDEDEAEWVQGCGCDIEDMFDFNLRKNPLGVSYFNDELEDAILSKRPPTLPQIQKKPLPALKKYYPYSLTDPNRLFTKDSELILGKAFTWVGPKLKTLDIFPEQLIENLNGNSFNFEKLLAIREAPSKLSSPLMMNTGIVEPFVLERSLYETLREENLFKTLTRKDIGEVFFSIYDGHHRMIGAALSGESMVVAEIEQASYAVYSAWKARGRPPVKWYNRSGLLVTEKCFEYLDNYMVSDPNAVEMRNHVAVLQAFPD